MTDTAPADVPAAILAYLRDGPATTRDLIDHLADPPADWRTRAGKARSQAANDALAAIGVLGRQRVIVRVRTRRHVLWMTRADAADLAAETAEAVSHAAETATAGREQP